MLHGIHGNLLNPREHRIFDFQKNLSQKKKKERRRKKELESSQETETTKKVIEWISRESQYSTVSRLILKVVFLLRDSEEMALTYFFYHLYLYSLYCFDPQSKQRKLKQKLVFTKKNMVCVYKAPIFFLHTHAQKKKFS